MFRSPFAPDPFNRRGGINQDAVKIEENCFCGKNHRLGYQHDGWGSGSAIRSALIQPESWRSFQLMEANAFQASVRITIALAFE